MGRRGPRRLDRWAAACFVVGLVACDSDPGPVSPGVEQERQPEPLSLRLVDVEPLPASSSPILDPAGSPTPQIPLLDALDLADAWTAVEQAGPVPGPVPSSEAGWVVPPSDARWVRLVPCSSIRDLCLSVRGRGDAEADESPVGLVELDDEAIGPPSPRLLRSVLRPRDTGPAVPGMQTRERRIRLAPRTRSLALVLQNRNDTTVTLEKVELTGLQGADRLALTLDERDELAHRFSAVGARVGVGRYLLESLLAPTPSRLEYELPDVGSQPLWLHTSLGVLRDESGLGRRTVDFRISVAGPDGARVVDEHSIVVRPGEAETRGPFFRRLELGVVAAGSRLVFETESDGEGEELVLAAFGLPVLRAGPPARAHGLVVVSLDTVRADRVGCYGNEQGLTPVLDQIAGESTRFARATAHASFTLPSHASAFSGQYPSIHGMQKPGLRRDPSLTRFLAEYARDAGYRTVAFTGGGQLAPAFGMADGFEIYQWRDSLLVGDFEDLGQLLDQLAGEPVMLFLHTYAAHHYEPPREILDAVHPPCGSPLHDRDSLRDYMLLVRSREFDAADRAHLAGVYDASVRFADRQLGRALAELRRRGVLDRDPMMVFSDHGEELFDHGQVGHGFRAPFQEQVHVPFLVRPAGGGPPRVFEGVVELVDFLPTALHLLSLSAPPMIQGQSLADALQGGVEEGGMAWSETPSGRYSSLQSADWKAMRHRKPGEEGEEELRVFDLRRDPEESNLLAEDDPMHLEATRRFQDAAQTLEQLVRRLDIEIRQASISPEELRMLLEMGYMEFDFTVVDDRSDEPDKEDSP